MRFVAENEKLTLKDKDNRSVITNIACGMNVFADGQSNPLLSGNGWVDNGNGVFSVREKTVSSRSDGDWVKFFSELKCGEDVGRCDEFVVMRGVFAERIVRFLAPFV